MVKKKQEPREHNIARTDGQGHTIDTTPTPYTQSQLQLFKCTFSHVSTRAILTDGRTPRQARLE